MKGSPRIPKPGHLKKQSQKIHEKERGAMDDRKRDLIAFTSAN